MYFSVAEQEVNLKGAAVRFAVDRADSAKVVLTVLAPAAKGGEGNEEHYRLIFNRNGALLTGLGPEELAIEKDTLARVAAQRRADLGYPVVTTGPEDAQKASKDAAAKQKAEDAALLASKPPVIKVEEPAHGGQQAEH